MHTHCPINCLGPAAIEHILHREPAQKKLYKWRFSAFSFLSQGLSRFLVCRTKLFIALSIEAIVLLNSWRMWHVVVAEVVRAARTISRG